MKNKSVLAVDLGGTKLLVGEVNRLGEVINFKKYDSGTLDQNDEVKLLENSIKDYILSVGFKNKKPSVLGMGLVGEIDYKNGIWSEVYPNHPFSFPICEHLSKMFDINCVADNDVKCATLGEQMFGNAKNVENFIYINIGTGISAGIVADNKILRGANNSAGELGHMIVNFGSSTKCICGRNGCVEALASGIGLSNRAHSLLPKFPSSQLNNFSKKGKITAFDVLECAKSFDTLSLNLFNDAKDALISLLSSVVWTFNPQKIIIGGGIANNSLMKNTLVKSFDSPTFKRVKDGIEFIKPQEAYGLIGSAALAFNKFG